MAVHRWWNDQLGYPEDEEASIPPWVSRYFDSVNKKMQGTVGGRISADVLLEPAFVDREVLGATSACGCESIDGSDLKASMMVIHLELVEAIKTAMDRVLYCDIQFDSHRSQTLLTCRNSGRVTASQT